MGDLAGVLVLLGLAVLAVPILLVIALVSISGLKRRVADLEAEVRHLRSAPRATAAPAAAYVPAPASTSVSGNADEPTAEADVDREPTLAELTRKASVQEPKAVSAPPVSPAPITPVAAISSTVAWCSPHRSSCSRCRRAC